MEKVMTLARERAVVIFSKSSCCMCHSMTVLFRELGVNPLVHELDGDSEGREMEMALLSLGCEPVVPTVYIGGVLVGSTRRVMSLHLEGSLIPMLKRARAIWL